MKSGHSGKKTTTFGVVATALIVSTLLFGVSSHDADAHHSHASLDMKNIKRHRGTVVRYGWGMPHVFLKVKAPNAAGDLVTYSIEMLHPPGMVERGWSRESFKPGDVITWEGPVDKNPNRYYTGMHWIEKADGTRFTMDIEDDPILPSTDFSGLWVRDLRGAPGHYAPPKDWPYTALAKAAVENFNEDQNPQLECMNPGPPKATFLPYPIQISRPDSETVVLEYELRNRSRTIYLGEAPANSEPSAFGTSVGHFEGDDLVVETTNFVADRWGIYTGVDSSAEKHLLERFSLIDDGLALRIRMTITDPVYLTEPVTVDYYMSKLGDRELVDVPCSIENATLFLNAGAE